jgi:uncharacterized membrane protein YtjA (UPF0391 family)
MGGGGGLGIPSAREKVGTSNPTKTMLHWTLVFLVIALIAAALGFGTLSGAAATIAQVLFVVFLIVWVASLIMGRGRRV